MISSGALFGKIAFYQLSIVADGQGGTSGVYSLVYSCRAAVTPLTGRRALEDGQIEGIRPMQFTIRWRPSAFPAANLILLYKGIPHSVYSIVDTNNKRQELVILARAKDSQFDFPIG